MNFGLGGYVAIGFAVVMGLLLWRNYSLGNERDAALERVGAQAVVIATYEKNQEYAIGTVAKWKDAAELFGEAVQEQSRVTYLATQERKNLNDAFKTVDAPDAARTDPRGLERRRNAGWERLNCLLSSGAGRDRCPAGPTAAGEAEAPAPATP